MFLNILITLFLLGLYLGELKKPATFISFLRPNDPLSDKYSSLQDYSIEKSGIYNQLTDHVRPQTNILKSIQYAPLKPEERAFASPQSFTSSINKVDLEPKTTEQSINKSRGSQDNFIQYIEGHNIVPLNRFKDGGYRHGILSEKSKQNMDEIEDDNLVSKFKQQRPEIEGDKVSLKNKQNLPKSDNPTKSFTSAIESSKIEPIFNPYVKVPRLHLNIARSYNFAKLPKKASLMGYQINTPKQSFVEDYDFLLKEKPFMYPVNNNHYTTRKL